MASGRRWTLSRSALRSTRCIGMATALGTVGDIVGSEFVAAHRCGPCRCQQIRSMLHDQLNSMNLRLVLAELRFNVAMRQLSLPVGPLKSVCLAAHPDDIEIAAGATLLGSRRARRC